LYCGKNVFNATRAHSRGRDAEGSTHFTAVVRPLLSRAIDRFRAKLDTTCCCVRGGRSAVRSRKKNMTDSKKARDFHTTQRIPVVSHSGSLYHSPSRLLRSKATPLSPLPINDVDPR
ncbi:unnamed protein product, partial [Ectocarpus sp. 8 AP-2014]